MAAYNCCRRIFYTVRYGGLFKQIKECILRRFDRIPKRVGCCPVFFYQQLKLFLLFRIQV